MPKNKEIDEMLDQLIAAAGPRVIEEMTKEDLKELDSSSYTFSEEHEKKMQEMFEQMATKGKISETQTTTKITYKTWRKIAVIAAAMVLVLGVAISSVGAWRESFVSLFLHDKGEYSDVREKNMHNEFIVDNILFGYIPNGYELSNTKKTDFETIYIFEQSQDEENYFIVEIQNVSLSSQQTNTENSITKDIVIQGKDMVYIENDLVRVITWYDANQIYSIQTNESENVLKKVVENMQFLENESTLEEE